MAKWSTVLQSFGDHPDPIDGAAIDAAVLRAARSIGRVLVLEDSCGCYRVARTADRRSVGQCGLVRDGVGARPPSDRQGAPTGPSGTALVDLGVDVREERPEDLLSLYGDGLDAVVVVGEGTDIGLSLRRPDGSSIPLIGQTEDRDGSRGRPRGCRGSAGCRVPTLPSACTLQGDGYADDPADEVLDPLGGLPNAAPGPP